MPHVFISLGAGVQSSVMSLMAAHGEIGPMPEGAIFADTQWEPPSVYKWLDWLETQLPYPVYRVTQGNLAEDNLRLTRSKKSGKIYSKDMIPAFTLDANGKRGMLMRKCTRDYKINVVKRKLRELTHKADVDQWIGISTDEAHRMKTSPEPWIYNLYPLIEVGMSRQDCLRWMEARGLPTPPRSACIGCPYHGDGEWLRLQRDEPEAFQAAVEWERRYQAVAAQSEVMTSTPYLHASRVPLDQVVFVDDADKPSQFGNECEGMCGV